MEKPIMRKHFTAVKRGFKGAARSKKANILVILILILTMRLFFYPFPLFSHAYGASIGASKISAAIQKIIKDENKGDKKAEKQEGIDPEVLDPLKKIGQSSLKTEVPESKCSEVDVILSEKEKEQKDREAVYFGLVQGHPIEVMIPEIAKKDKKVAAFLIGIAKKESSWGEHSPKKNGKECYNYWGYKGGQNPTVSGYSCFDDPRQAVTVVGGRIGELVGKKINTPERMIVWKCGRSCAGHDPGSVKKWISDVSSYFYLSGDKPDKLNS